MRHIIYEQSDSYPVAVLVKDSAFMQAPIFNYYVEPLTARGISKESIIAFNLKYDSNKKVSAAYAKTYLETLLPALVSCGTQYLLVGDVSYFKFLTKQGKADPHFGYVLPCAIKGYEALQVVLSINHQALIFNPGLKEKLDMSLDTLASHIQGNHVELGSNIIHSAQYPQSLQEIADALESLHQYETLACDIEGFSLRFNEAGIGTIAFAWDQHNGVAFACDYFTSSWDEGRDLVNHGMYRINHQVRALLKNFFTRYKGRIRWHNAPYDLKAIIESLWMTTLLDSPGMLHGLETMTRSFDDTKVIAYLATNSTAGNVLGLKALAHPFAGNWAKDEINDIRKIPLKELLQYNLVDALSTNYVYDTYAPIMVQDQQEDLYESLMLPTLKVIIQMEMVGMPMNAKRIQEVREELEAKQEAALDLIHNSPVIKMLNLLLQTSEMEKANAKLKTKQHPLEKFADITFNPNSGPQVQRLLYEMMGLPVIDKTATGQPSVGADTVEKLINHVQEPEYKEILQALIDYGKVNKILGTFIPAFERGIDKADGAKYLHGSFNLGGTVSGRLSSSDPNLQNLPAGSTYGELIKTCFTAPEGWLFVGADFNALEARINALLTKDPNKLEIYLSNVDSHSWNALGYWPELMPEIKSAVDRADLPGKFYKVTYENGAVDFVHESDPRIPQLSNREERGSLVQL